MAGAEAGFKLFGIARLGEEVVGAGAQASDNILLGFLGGEQRHVDISFVLAAADGATDSGTVELRHDPIDERETRTIELGEISTASRPLDAVTTS